MFELIWASGRATIVASISLRAVLALLPLAALWIGKQIIDLVVRGAKTPGSHSQVIRLLIAECAIATLGAILSRAIDYCDALIADKFSREVGLRVMKHAAILDLQSFEDPTFYDRLERARVQGTDRLGMLNALGRLLQQSITLVSLAVTLLLYSPILFAVTLLAAIPSFLGESHFAFLEYSLAYSLTPLRRELDYLRDLGTKKESAKERRVFGLSDFLSNRFKDIHAEVIGRRSKLAGRRLRISALLAAFGSLGYYGSYAFLVLRTVEGALTVGTLTLLAGALAGCSSQIQLLFSSFTSIADQAFFLTDLFEFFAVKPKIVNAPNPIPAPRVIRDGFEFQDVYFAYPNSNRVVLKDINLKIAPGERIALVGANGEGKTTLVKLMSRLYDPTAGVILLDGVDLREYDLASLHQRIGVIFQDFMRYDLTARENIAMGRIDHSGGEEEIIEAAEESGAIEVISRLPDGLDQMLGRRFEGGVDLSGGEWQKFALARAYLRDAQVLILDEPTAALDAIAEHEVFTRFAELTHQKMAILISHRLSTVRMCDRIVVLHEGTIHEEGTHQQLMRRGRRYAGMFELQASRYRSAHDEEGVLQAAG